MKVALVHEFLTQLGGAERVLQNFLEIWPEPILHVLIYNNAKTEGIFEKYTKKISFINNLPGARDDHKIYLALMPNAIESFSFSGFDVVLSDSSSFAKGAITKGQLHICYCHTPTRFLWTEPQSYLNSQPYSKVIKVMALPILSWIRRWDYKASNRPHYFIANSKNVQDRIKKYYGRESEVIYPPVDAELFTPTGTKQNYFLVASRLEPYKKVELVIEAFKKLNLPLKVVGSGTREKILKEQAGANIEFLGRVTDEELRKLYSEARAYVFPAEEDAGIMLLESQACGTPVIAYKAGGALELLKENETGIYFAEQTAESIIDAVKRFESMSFDPIIIRKFAQQFDKKIFQQKIKEFVELKYKEFYQK